MKIDKIRVKIIIIKVCLNNTIYKGNNIAVIMEPADTMRVAKNIAAHVPKARARIIARPLISKASPIRTPSVVATPLPPLNFKKTVQLCPAIHPNPHASGKSSL